MSNLDLWQSVGKTDPRYTKTFKKTGGFEGTAINATWLAQRATETFGPMGIGWGVEVLGQQYAIGAPILHKESGAVIGNEIVHTAHIRLWYVHGGERGAIEHIGCTTFVGTNKYGPFTDEDHAKKSLTDATTKALSLLGFAADVHLGLFDDNKYVADMRREFADPPPTRQEPRQRRDESPDAGLPSEHAKWVAGMVASMREAALAKDRATVERLRDQAKARCTAIADVEGYQAILDAMKNPEGAHA